MTGTGKVLDFNYDNIFVEHKTIRDSEKLILSFAFDDI